MQGIYIRSDILALVPNFSEEKKIPLVHLSPNFFLSFTLDCRYKGIVYKAGQSFKPDQCNTCWCTVSGDVSCTKFSCYPGI